MVQICHPLKINRSMLQPTQPSSNATAGHYFLDAFK